MRRYLWHIGLVLAAAIWASCPTHAYADGPDKSGVKPQVINLPSGPGSIQGLGDAFQPQLNSGTASYRVPLTLPPGVGGHTPSLSLAYNAGLPNGPFGLGWTLGLPSIQRQTDKGLPCYDASAPPPCTGHPDLFIHGSGEELVPLADGSYRFKTEGAFTQFHRVGEGWEATEKDGTHWTFGETIDGRQTNSLGTFAWQPQRSTDPNSNEVRFFYRQDGGQPYLREIRYNFDRSFDYDQEHGSFVSITLEYEPRPDPITDYRSRAKVVTALRAHAFEIRALGQLVRRYELSYDDSQGMSLLVEVRELGADLARFEADPTKAIPPVRFTYSPFDILQRTRNASMSHPPVLRLGDPANPNSDLVDINGDALPDIVYTDARQGHSFYVNQGRARWASEPVRPAQSPPDALATKGVQIADMDGDGLADLLVRPGQTVGVHSYYYPNHGRQTWERADQMDLGTNLPFTFEDGDVQLVDLDHDKRVDVLRTGSDGHNYVYFNRNNIWSPGPDRILPALAFGARLGFTDPRVQLADLNGDRLQDMVLVMDSQNQVVYFPSRGLGDFDQAILMSGSPNLRSRAGKILVGDVNGDGLADLLLVQYASVSVWLNQAGRAFGPEVVLSQATLGREVPKYLADKTTLRLADMDGDGSADLVYSTYPLGLGETADDILRYLDFHGGMPSHLLQTIDNGLGRVITLHYRTSTEYATDDQDMGQPWTLTSPVPVWVVSQSVVHDNNSGQDYTTDYTYRNAYYDYQEKAFRGFALAEEKDRGDNSAPTQVRRVIFDTGAPRLEETSEPARQAARTRKGSVLQSDILGEGGTCGEDEAYAAESAATSHKKVGARQWIERRASLLQDPDARDEQRWKGGVSACYNRAISQIATRSLAVEDAVQAAGHTPRVIAFSVISQTDTLVYEATSSYRRKQETFAYDDYGNQTQHFDYGEVAPDGSNPGMGHDERLTYTIYVTPTNGIRNRINETWTTDLQGTKASWQRRYYDGTAFEGLRLGRMDKGNLARVEDNLGPAGGNHWVQSQRYRYDEYGNQIARMDPNGMVTAAHEPSEGGHWTEVHFDSVFHTYPVTETIHLEAGRALMVSAQYDFVLGVMQQATDFNNHVVSFGYDALARLTSIVKPGDSRDLPTQVFTYTIGSAVSSIATASRERSGESDVYRSVSYVDGLGRKLQTRSDGEDGKVVVKDGVTYNLRGKEHEKYRAYFANSLAYSPLDTAQPKTTLAYDPTDRVVQSANPDGTFARTQYLPFKKAQSDEENTNPSSPHFRKGRTFVYDGLGREIQTLELNGTDVYTTVYAHDLLDNLITITDTQGNVKHQTFDWLKRKVAMADPDRGPMAYTYDDAGNAIETADAKGQRILLTYDGANRLLTENDVTSANDQSIDVRYHYDGDLALEYPNAQNTLSRLAWIEDASGREYVSYDDRGRVVGRIKRIAPEGVRPLDFVSLIQYDAMDRATGLTYPDGFHLTPQYNGQSLLEAIPGYVDNIDYIASGQRGMVSTSDGVTTTYDYDTRLRMTDLRSTHRSGVVLQALHYRFDGVSNILSIDDSRPDRTSQDDDSRVFAYDDLYRLTHVGYLAPTASDTVDYSYDPLGNLTSQRSTVASANLGTLRYGADAGPHALTNVQGGTWTYDRNGNLTTNPSFSLTWDFRDRLTSVVKEELRQDNSYDHSGVRIGKQVRTSRGTETTLYPDKTVEVRGQELVKYVFAGDQRIAEVRTAFDPGRLIEGFAGSPQTLFGFDANHDGSIGADEIAGRGGDPTAVEFDEIVDALELFFAHTEDAHPVITFATISAALDNYRAHSSSAPQTETVFYHPDHLGSASVLTDGGGKLVERATYYPYGADRYRDGNSNVIRRFTGQEQDNDIDLYYYGARYYDPVVGRFISVDPVDIEGSTDSRGLQSSIGWPGLPSTDVLSTALALNPYTYALMNPLKYVDPDGREIRFAPGSTPAFKEQLKAIINYLNKGHVSSVIAQLERSSTVVYVKQGGTNTFRYADATRTIEFDPMSGLKVRGGKVQTPALGFLHEAGHALQHARNPEQYARDSNARIPHYDDKEEQRVVMKIETPAAKKLHEPTRTDHRGTSVQVKCPTCNK